MHILILKKKNNVISIRNLESIFTTTIPTHPILGFSVGGIAVVIIYSRFLILMKLYFSSEMECACDKLINIVIFY